MKRKPFLILLCLALLLPLLFVSICAVGLPAKYDATYMGELKYKYRRLESVQGRKIVLIGGSSTAFGADSPLIEKEFPEYEVVNFGMYAALGSRMMLDLAMDSIGEGDIVIFMPEISEQTLSDFTDGTYALQGLDGAWDLLRKIRPGLYPSILGAMPAFAMEKLHCQMGRTLPEPGELYRRDSFNEYGDVDNEMVSQNIMPEEYDPDLPVFLSDSLPTEEFIDYLNEYARKLSKKGASFYYHFCPVDELSVTGQAEQAATDFHAHLDKVLDFSILGDPRDAMMEAGWFYDTNFHLNRAGKTVFTRQLVRDLKAELSDTSLTEVAIPGMPRPLSFSQMSDDDGTVLRRSTYAGNTGITQITIPETVRRIEDESFDGCTSLEAVYLEEKEPSRILVGRHLLDGTSADLFVPAESLSAYRTDYRFSQYADRIQAR